MQLKITHIRNISSFLSILMFFLLLIYYCQSLPYLAYFGIDAGESQRNIDIQSCYEAIGVNNVQAFLDFHVLTGCYSIWRFSRKAKHIGWKLFLKADNNILNGLTQFGTNESLQDFVTLSTLEDFMVNTCGMYYIFFKANASRY